MGKDGPALILELPAATGSFHDHVRAQNIRRHQVGSELDAVEGEVQHLAERAHQQGFSQAGHAFQQHMPAGKQSGQGAFDNRFVPDNDLANFTAQRGVRPAKGLNLLLGLHLTPSDHRNNPARRPGRRAALAPG